MPENLPVVLIHATLWWPLAARLAISFRDLGCRVHSICPPVHPLHFVRGIERCHSLRSLWVQRSLIEAIEDSQPDYIVPTDDRAIWQLHALVASHPQYRGLVVNSLGDSKSFAVVRSRMSLLALAESLKIQIPMTVLLRSEQEAADYASSWSYPAVVKLDGTNGGRGVAIVSTPLELLDAYRRLRRKPSFLSSLKRRVVDNDVMAFFKPGTTLPPQEISLQSFVTGTPANAMYSCFRGKLLADIQVRTICSQHAAGAALIVERINDLRIENAGRKLAQALSLSGFLGLDFILENGTGTPYLLEMNPRATQLGHLPLECPCCGGSLAEALWRAWTCGTPPRSVVADQPFKLPGKIAFFPQALALGPNSSLLASAWLDRPDDEPNLVRELSKVGWPERRLVYRLFHKFYNIQPDKPVDFPEADSNIGTALNKRLQAHYQR